MAGRDLFATTTEATPIQEAAPVQTEPQSQPIPTQGRNLLAEQPSDSAQTPTSSPRPPRPSMQSMKERYLSGSMNQNEEKAFEELATRHDRRSTFISSLPSIDGLSEPISTLSISEGSPFKEPTEQPQATEEDGTLKAFIEPIATIGSAAIAEPLAGIAGIAQSLNPLADEGAGAEAVEKTREALTYQPETEGAKEVIGELGGMLQPVAEFMGEIETSLGDSAYNKTGSPALAAAAATIPTALVEVLGLASGRGALRSARKVKKKLADGQIAREINEAAPTIEQLKTTASGIYKEIDDMGASVKQSSFSKLVDDLTARVEAEGIDKTITPKATAALKRFEEMKGGDVALQDVDKLRKIAGSAADAIEPSEARLGMRMIEAIDDFVDTADQSVLSMPKHLDPKNVGKRYKMARDIWGRARKSEMVQTAFENARNQASGFENGIRTQFRAILNNKKKSKFFNRDELNAMKRVVRGSTKENIAKLIGRFGFSEGGAMNMLGGSIGVGAGAAVGGAPGAMIVPIIGQVSRKLAQRMTAKGAEFADQVIRAGRNAKEITKTYIRNTPKALRSSDELSELLVRNDIDLVDLPADTMVEEAVRLAMNRRSELAGVAATQLTEGAEDKTQQ